MVNQNQLETIVSPYEHLLAGENRRPTVEAMEHLHFVWLEKTVNAADMSDLLTDLQSNGYDIDSIDNHNAGVQINLEI